VATPGYYSLTVNGNGGYAYATVNCALGGSLSADTSNGGWGYLNGGACYVLEYGEYTSSGDLSKL
jgi:hypothetical protein